MGDLFPQTPYRVGSLPLDFTGDFRPLGSLTLPHQLNPEVKETA